MKGKPQAPIRTRHDEWAKRALSLWLGALGEVRIDARVAGESRRGDVLYTERRGGHGGLRRRLGVLGDLARGVVLFELFRNPVGAVELTSCVLKGVDLRAQEARAARRAKQRLSRDDGPLLCVVTPTLSEGVATEVEATLIARERPGVYRLAPVWRTVVVVAKELRVERGTMWLRLLGRGKVQERAVGELQRMSARDPLRDATMALLVAWRQSLPPPEKQTPEERELSMNLERIYERWERKTLARGEAKGRAEGRAEGRVEGRVEGRAAAVLTMLDARGLAITAAQRKRVLACTDSAVLDAWIRAAATAPSAAEALSAGTPSRRRAAQARGRASVR